MFIERVKETIEEGGLELFDDFLEALHHAGCSTEQVVSALVKMNMGVAKNEFADENLDGELERQSRKYGRDDRGYAAEGLHGDLRQNQRTQVMNRFRSGAVSILVATDVAARGLDVDNVDGVINYDIPLDEEYYVHRIGRTGRAGKSGKAFTLVVGSERNRLREIMNYTKVKIDKGVIPSFTDVVGIKKGMFIERVKETIEEGGLELFDDVLEALHHAGCSTEQVVSALVKMNMGVAKNELWELS